MRYLNKGDRVVKFYNGLEGYKHTYGIAQKGEK